MKKKMKNNYESQPQALRRAQEIAFQKNGHVPTMPESIVDRLNNLTGWHQEKATLSEEIVGKSGYGNQVVAISHGPALIGTVEDLEKAVRNPVRGTSLIPDSAASIGKNKFRRLLDGKLPSGDELPVYPIAELLSANHLNFPSRYIIVLDLSLAEKSESGYIEIQRLAEDALFTARIGSRQKALEYLGEAGRQYGTARYGNWHTLNHSDLSRPHGRLLILGGNAYAGIVGDSSIIEPVRFAVLPGKKPKAVHPLERIAFAAR